jgi:hypothetical protein
LAPASANPEQLSAIAEQLRGMRYEVSRLTLKIREYEEDSGHWVLRYSRRFVIISNVLLGTWMFFERFVQCVRRRSKLSDSVFGRLFLPLFNGSEEVGASR